jgi:hypothetical protein
MRAWRERVRDRLNDLAFRWRSMMRWSAPVWKLPARSLAKATAALAPEGQRRAEQLAAGHDLSRWPQLLTALELRENLYTLDLLHQLLPGALPPGPALEVGSKNGALLPAQQAAWPHPWDLVELDAHRRYLDLSTRRAHGERMAAAFAGCRYVAGSVTEMTGQYALVSWFLPFVHERPLEAWGLPRRFFDPPGLFRHVVGRVAPGGALFIVNQGEGERETQRGLFAAAGLSPVDLGALQSPLSPFRRPRFGFLWRRPL